MSRSINMARGVVSIALPALLLTGCEFDGSVTSEPGDPGAGASAPAGSDGDGGTSEGDQGGGAPAGGSAGQAAGERCHTDDLSAEAVARTVDTDNEFILRLTNTSGRTCHTQGWVGLSMDQGSLGTQAVRVVRAQGTASRVVLPPKATAWTLLSVAAGASRGCVKEARVLVIPPDETTPVSAQWPGLPVCDNGQISVRPLQRGTGG
jgi:hypothetical protein